MNHCAIKINIVFRNNSSKLFFLGLSNLAWSSGVWNSHWRALYYPWKWWCSLGRTCVWAQSCIPQTFHYGPQSRWYGGRPIIVIQGKALNLNHYWYSDGASIALCSSVYKAVKDLPSVFGWTRWLGKGSTSLVTMTMNVIRHWVKSHEIFVLTLPYWCITVMLLADEVHRDLM